MHADQAAINRAIQQLEKDFKILSAAFYQTTANNTNKQLQPITDIDPLLRAVNQLLVADQPIKAIQLLQLNTRTIKANLDNKAIFVFIELLLDNNEWSLASRLRKEVEITNNPSILATVQFIFTKYHARQDEWIKVYALLKDNVTTLSKENTNFAYLLNGTALQHLKKHRQAIESYKKIAPASQYHSYAQLNMAVAHIRLGWWTDAKSIIQQQLNATDNTDKDEFSNRLYLILGYALLQREFYRDAHNAFRHVGLNSRYTSRALLGIGLTATSQGDYADALNVFTKLQNKTVIDLPVDESYLLVTYAYENLHPSIAAVTVYSKAINYYKQRMDELDDIASEYNYFDDLSYNAETLSYLIQNNKFDYGSRYPESFILNFQRLRAFYKNTNNKDLKHEISTLITRFDATFQDIIVDLVNERKTHLNSYLNQSRFGLAQLYDRSGETDD